jgi:glycerate-2-kinase
MARLVRVDRAFAHPTEHPLASRAGGWCLDPAAFLPDNNSTEFFAKARRLSGATCTNINDFRAILDGQ